MRKRRWLRVLVVLGVLAVLAFAWRAVRPYLRPSPAAPDAATLAHVAAVEILRDTWGVPHIYGKTDADAAFGLAYAHAEDDFPMIQGVLAAARGRLSLLMLSRQALANDYYVKLIRAREQVATIYPTFSPEMRAVLEAYARGLNHYAWRHPHEVDGRLLPYRGEDIAAGFAHKLPVLMGFADVLSRLVEEPPDGVGAQMPKPRPTGGSNAHAVHRARSTDDVTRLNVNSHQPWEGPVAWYEAQIHSGEGWNMTGGTFPGAPFILHGHNDHLGWAHTVNEPDLVNVYLLTMRGEGSLEYRLDDRWVPLEVADADIVIDTGFFDFTFDKEVYHSAHGPVMKTDRGFFAVRYAGMARVVLAAEQWFRMNKAKNFQEWRDAMSLRGIPMFNTIYADRDNIHYVYNAMIPVRADGFDYGKVLPGDRDAAIWKDLAPYDRLPTVTNPDSGFVQNCNSTPFQTTTGAMNPISENAPRNAGIETHLTNRAARSLALFGDGRPISREDFLRFKWDRGYAPDAAIFTDLVRPLLAGFPAATDGERRALEILRAWDGTTSEQGPALPVVAWRLLAKDGQVPPDDKAHDPPEALRRALSFLGRPDVPLGEVTRLRRGEVDLPLGGGPDVLNAVYTHERGGKLIAYQGDSYVMLVEFGAGGVTSSSIDQYGSSNRGGSPHHADQAPLFVARELKPTWRTEAEVRAHLERAYHPGEEK